MSNSYFETKLVEIDTYKIPDSAKALWKELFTKLNSLLTALSICCNEDMDSVMIWKDDDKFYFDIELNDDLENGEDGTKFSMLARNRVTKEDKWIAEFSIDDVTPEWVMEYIPHFSIRKA